MLQMMMSCIFSFTLEGIWGWEGKNENKSITVKHYALAVIILLKDVTIPIFQMLLTRSSWWFVT
jgi:hypothetical protein